MVPYVAFLALEISIFMVYELPVKIAHHSILTQLQIKDCNYLDLGQSKQYVSEVLDQSKTLLHDIHSPLWCLMVGALSWEVGLTPHSENHREMRFRVIADKV